MDSSLSEWLSLREAADWAARSHTVFERARAALPARGPIRVLDLCTGSGSNLRYLMDRLPDGQDWLVIDRDQALLDELSVRLHAWLAGRRELHCNVETRQMNLSTLEEGIFTGRHLVTASALLDLVSEEWLRLLAARCRSVGAVALFTITYTGRSTCDPIEPEDDLVLELFNRHQKTDKGLGGPAAGPDASAAAERAFTGAGYRVERAPSNWTIEPDARAFQRQLIDGWAGAASEIAPAQAGLIADWHSRRMAHVEAGRSRLVVHHDDLVAWNPEPEPGTED